MNKRIYSFSIENKELVDVIDIDEEVTSLNATVIFILLILKYIYRKLASLKKESNSVFKIILKKLKKEIYIYEKHFFVFLLFSLK